MHVPLNERQRWNLSDITGTNLRPWISSGFDSTYKCIKSKLVTEKDIKKILVLHLTIPA